MSILSAYPHERVLIVKPSSFGDIIHTLPAVRALRRTLPNSDLRWLIQPQWAPLLEENPDINGIITFPRNRFRGLFGAARFFVWARQAQSGFHADLAVDFQGLLRSALSARLLGAKQILGAADAREGATLLYTNTVQVDACHHAIFRNLALVGEVGVKVGQSDFPLPLGTPPEVADWIPQRFFVLHPFSRGANKSLTPRQAMKLCLLLKPAQVVVAGFVGVREEFPENAINLLGATSLSELIWLLRNAVAVISVDSGPAHLASAVGTPLVAIHTWSDPARVGPLFNHALVWQKGAICKATDFLGQSERHTPGGLPKEKDLAVIAEAACSIARSYS